MKVWKDREGKAVSGKEFMTRWQAGIRAITPLQQTQSALFGFIVIFVGIIWGLVFTAKLGHWWLFTILLGSIFVSGSQAVATLQKYHLLKSFEKEVRNGINQTETTSPVVNS